MSKKAIKMNQHKFEASRDIQKQSIYIKKQRIDIRT